MHVRVRKNSTEDPNKLLESGATKLRSKTEGINFPGCATKERLQVLIMVETLRHALLCYQTVMNLAHETHRRRQVCLVQSHSYSSSCPLCGRSNPIPVGSNLADKAMLSYKNLVTKKQCAGAFCQHLTQTFDAVENMPAGVQLPEQP